MKKQSTILALFASMCLLAQSGPAFSKDRTITGTIQRFECGDNCYLIILDSTQTEQTGLCVAKECEDWNSKTEMPSRFQGKRVKVSVGLGKQYDDSGNLMGEMMSFKKIRFLD